MDWREAAGAKLDVARRKACANKRPGSARKRGRESETKSTTSTVISTGRRLT